ELGSFAEAQVLVEAVAGILGVRRLPVQLVGHLLDVAAEQRLHDLETAGVAAQGLERRIDPGKPVGLQQHAALGPGIVQELEHQVAVAVAGAVLEAFGHHRVGRSLDGGDLGGGQEARDDGVTVLAQVLDMAGDHGCSRKVGSRVTGKFTERAMKQSLWASAWSARAFARSAPGFTVTSGFSTTPVKRPPPSASSIMVPSARSA